MGTRQLIAALRETAEEKARAFQFQASREAEEIRAETGRRIEELRGERRAAREREAREYAQGVVAAARQKARGMGLGAYHDLARRLYLAARESLPSLRNGDYDSVFARLADELPHQAWATVRVNPADMSRARGRFSTAQLIGDEKISGGIDAATKDETVRIDNTFEKRLERAWEGLLPGIMKELRDVVHDERS